MTKKELNALARLGKAIAECAKAGIDKDTIIGSVGVVLSTPLRESKPRRKKKG